MLKFLKFAYDTLLSLAGVVFVWLIVYPLFWAWDTLDGSWKAAIDGAKAAAMVTHCAMDDIINYD